MHTYLNRSSFGDVDILCPVCPPPSLVISFCLQSLKVLPLVLTIPTPTSSTSITKLTTSFIWLLHYEQKRVTRTLKQPLSPGLEMVAQQSPLYTWYSVWPKSLVPEPKLKYRFSLCCRYSTLQEAAAQDKDFCLDHTLNLKHTHVHCSQFKLPCTVLDANGMILLYVPLLTSIMCKESTEPCDHTHCFIGAR